MSPHRRQQWEELTAVVMSTPELNTLDFIPMSTAPAFQTLNEAMVQIADHDNRGPALRVMLARQRVRVTFRKADGSLSDMTCTTHENFIPLDNRPKKQVHEENSVNSDPGLFKVWAVDRAGWRSFRLERVTQITPL